MGSPLLFDDLASLQPDPLDMEDVLAGGMAPAGGPVPRQAGPVPPPGRGLQGPQAAQTRQQWLKLALMLPLALRAGPGAVQGLLGGFNVAGTQAREEAERQRVIGERERATQATEQYRQDVLGQQQDMLVQREEAQRRTAQLALLKQASDAIAATTTPEELRGVLQLYSPQAAAVGLPPGRLEAFAAQAATPLRQRATKIRAAFNRLPADMKQRAIESRMGLMVEGEPQAIVYADWAPLVGGLVTATGQAIGATPSKTGDQASLERYAKSLGKSVADLTFADELVFERRMGEARREPDKTGGAVDAGTLELAKLAARQPAVLQGLTPTLSGQVVKTIAADPALRVQYEQTRMAPIRAAAQRVVTRINDLVDAKTNRLTAGARAIYGVGPGRVTRLVPGSGAANAKAALDQVTGNLTLNMLAEAKAQSRTGATGFGQLSNRELDVIESAATVLKGEISEDAALRELLAMRERLSLMLQPSTGEPPIGTPPPTSVPAVEIGQEYLHPQHGRVRVIGRNPDGTWRIERIGR